MPELLTRWVPPGVLGTEATLRLMRALVQRAVRDPTVQAWARTVAVGVTPAEQVRGLDAWMRTHFVYQDDPRKVDGVVLEDYLIDPRVAVQWDQQGRLIQGDCDDAAMLVATVAGAVGLPATFRAVGFAGPLGPLSHVYVLVRVGDRKARIDTTRPWGLPLPPVTRTLELEV